MGGEGGGGVRRRLAGLPLSARWWFLTAAILMLAFLCWLGFEALAAKSGLEKAKSNAQQAKDSLLAGKSDEATRWAENALINAEQAQAAAHSLPWSVAAAIPLLGSPLRTTQQMSDVVVGLAGEVLIPATKAGAGISPDKLAQDGRIDLNLLRAQQPKLAELAMAAAALNRRAQAISNPFYSSLIRDARSQLLDQTTKLSQLLGNADLAAQLAPSMLGADGPRNYLMTFQTNAEARGTGGLAGGFGVLRFDDGKPAVDTLASNTELKGAKADIDLGPEFDTLFGWTNPYTDYRNSNLSSHFPDAAQIWKSMWERKSGATIDGVIAIDPVALSYVLTATGPVTLTDGEVIDADNVVELTMSTAYSRFPAEKLVTPQAIVYKSDRRKQYLQQIAAAVVAKLSARLPAPRKLLDALGKAASERRLSVWTALPADQKLLEETPLAHVVPDDAAPYAEIVVNNLGGNKMDYYLKRGIEYAADACDSDMRNSTITLRLSNTATTDMQLPDEVAGMQGISPEIALKAPSGTMVSSIRLIATKGAKLMSVTSDGKQTPASTNVENGHPSFEVQVAIPPGQSAELTFRLSEPTSPGEPRVPVQPLIDNVKPNVSVPTCSG